MLYLSEHLWLAHDHRVQAGGNAEDMTNDIVIPKFVEIWTKLGVVSEQVVTQKCMEVRALIGAGSELHTVASGEDNAFAHGWMRVQLACSFFQLPLRNRKPLAHFHGRGLVIDAEQLEFHRATNL